VTVVTRNQNLSERVRADLHERGFRPTREHAGHNAALIFQTTVVAREQMRYTEGWALEGGGRRFEFPQWHAWVTVHDGNDEHVIDVTPGWFDDPRALYAPLFEYGIGQALKYGTLPIHGDGPLWMDRPRNWPSAPGGTIQVTTFEPPDSAR
jgi:hypothetical protein